MSILKEVFNELKKQRIKKLNEQIENLKTKLEKLKSQEFDEKTFNDKQHCFDVKYKSKYSYDFHCKKCGSYMGLELYTSKVISFWDSFESFERDVNAHIYLSNESDIPSCSHMKMRKALE